MPRTTRAHVIYTCHLENQIVIVIYFSFLSLYERWQATSRTEVFFLNFLIFIYFWERDSVWAGKEQRDTHTQNAKQAPGSELSAQSPMWSSNSLSCEIMIWAKVGCSTDWATQVALEPWSLRTDRNGGSWLSRAFLQSWLSVNMMGKNLGSWMRWIWV